jgi:peroxin-1
LNKLPQNIIIELSWQDSKSPQRSYVGWSGSTSKQSDANADIIEIDPQFGMAIGLHDGQKVITRLTF